jgi:leucyl/phenylalanyl-tRNA---protein transferase
MKGPGTARRTLCHNSRDSRSARLTPELLRLAYAQGYFPMPHPDTGEILWFNPDPRAMIPLDGFHVSKSLARTLKRGAFRTTINQDFRAVMQGCADREETWITEEFFEVYGAMHDLGLAHSIEVWHGPQLVGGTYGVSLGGGFFAESMFHTENDASKVALHTLVHHMRQRGMTLLEVQFLTPHLQSLGAIEVPQSAYLKLLQKALSQKETFAEPKVL